MLIKLGNLLLKPGNFKRAKQYGSDALTLISSQKVTAYNKNKTLITILNLLGQASKNSGDLRTSLDYFKKASEAAVKLSDSVLYSKMLNEIGGVFMLTQKYDSAFQYFNLSYIISNNASDTIGITQSLQGLGRLYFEKGLKIKPLTHYTQCNNNIAVKHIDIPTTITALVNISLCHFQLNDYPTSSHF
jgi:tetratricopeptide (TPR) repeat protein